MIWIKGTIRERNYKQYMISFYKALEEIDKAVGNKKLAVEHINVMDSVGRTLAEDIFSPLDIQPFDNSAMDGFAVKVSDLSHATKEQPITLRKIQTITATASERHYAVAPQTCVHIMTGAVVPDDTEAIVPIENVMIKEDEITFFSCPQVGAHIRRKGQDFKVGQPVLPAGTKISTSHILPLTTLGISRLSVVSRPRVLFIATGAELVTDLDAPLQEGQIYNSNAYFAQAYLSSIGAEVDSVVIDEDDQQEFFTLLEEAQIKSYDLIVSSGAVSAGVFDYVRTELERGGAEIIYHKIALKPGKPNLLARLPSGQVYFGLPGNPVATAVGMRFFVRRSLCMMMGEKIENPISARITHDFEKNAPLHLVLKGSMRISENGMAEVTVLDGQESFMVNPFLHMNCWVFVPQDKLHLTCGECVQVCPI